MAGFFKKLFNRITGKPTEEVKVEEVQPAQLPAPEPEREVAASPLPKQGLGFKPTLSKKAKVDSGLRGNDGVESKTKKAPAKKVAAKKPEIKKADTKKPALKKAEVQKPTPKTADLKKVAAKRPEPKKPEPKQLAPKQPFVKQIVAPPAKIEKPQPELPPPQPVAVAPPSPEPVADAPARGGWFSRLKEGLSKSSKSIGGSITAIFTKRKLDKATLQELEDTLIQADLGLPVAERIIARVSQGRFDKEIDPEEVKQILADEVAKVLRPVEVPFNFGSEKPFVIMVVGVNGSGKTTTIGKLGSIAAAEGFKVMFAACDTFRAAAIEQLTVWGNRIGAETMSRPTGADSAGLAFDALKTARENSTDILFIDTAGRLQNKAYLMDELDKVVRVIKKQDAAAPHAVLLVLDATTGQNALAQAEVFTKVAGVTGLIMTKLDGTARGGILVAIAEKFQLPIHAIGVGEKIDDLQPFDAQGFARAIAGFEDA